MSCNCKNKKGITSKTPQTLSPKIEVKASTPVTYEEVLVIENLLPDINTNSEKRAVITEFVKLHFGEIIVNYCDQNCQSRIKDRLKTLKESLK